MVEKFPFIVITTWGHKLQEQQKLVFIDVNKTWNENKLNNIFSKYIVDNIINISIPVNDVQDKIIWKFIFDEKFSVITANSVDNDQSPLHLRTKLLIIFQN